MILQGCFYVDYFYIIFTQAKFLGKRVDLFLLLHNSNDSRNSLREIRCEGQRELGEAFVKDRPISWRIYAQKNSQVLRTSLDYRLWTVITRAIDRVCSNILSRMGEMFVSAFLSKLIQSKANVLPYSVIVSIVSAKCRHIILQSLIV